VQRDAGRTADAIESLREAVTLYSALVMDFPDVREHRTALAAGAEALGKLLAKSGQGREAESYYRRAIGLYRRLAAETAETTARNTLRRSLVSCHHELGDFLERSGRAGEAEAEFRLALAGREQLVEHNDTPEARSELADTQDRLALLVRAKGDTVEARRLLEWAIHYQSRARDARPESTADRRLWVRCQAHYAETLLALGDHQGVAQAAHELQSRASDDPSASVSAAEFLARCIRMAEADAGLTQAERAGKVDSYGRDAVKILSAAITKRYKNPDELLGKSVFDPLRARDDFQSLRSRAIKRPLP
jgi:tetratricopeptide (TPR) repeat protein